MKYNCNITKDYIHELRRMCASMPNCEICVLYAWTWASEDACSIAGMNDELIERIQKWSDEHPEKPKLTREEHDFLASFMFPDELAIRKGGVTMQLDTKYGSGYSNATIPLNKNMFHFIDEDKDWTVEELLKLEVEE